MVSRILDSVCLTASKGFHEDDRDLMNGCIFKASVSAAIRDATFEIPGCQHTHSYKNGDYCLAMRVSINSVLAWLDRAGEKNSAMGIKFYGHAMISQVSESHTLIELTAATAKYLLSRKIQEE